MIPPTTGIVALLADLAGRKVELRAEGPCLRCRPRAALTGLLAQRIRDNKCEIMALLVGAGDTVLTTGELLVLAKAGATIGEVPQVLVAKDAFAGIGGLSLVGLSLSPDGGKP